MTQAPSAITIARRLDLPVRSLAALVTPLAHGGCDGHGKPIAAPADSLRLLGDRLREAQAVIHQAIEDIDHGL